VKSFSLILNIILLLAVGFLFYKIYFPNASCPICKLSGKGNDTLENTSPALVSAISLSSAPRDAKIVFINADSVYAHYEFAKKTRTFSDAKAAGLEKSYRQKVADFQKEYQDYVEKAGAGMYTKEQGIAIEESLRKKQQEILEMEGRHGKMLDEMEQTTLEVQQKIYDYLHRFNRQNGYSCVLAYTKTGGGVLGINDSLDVTALVIQGLNEEYKAETVSGKKNK
jgi:outer membrane protein